MAMLQADVIIVGAGVVGASLALALAQGNTNWSIVMVDAAPAPSLAAVTGFDSRVVALNAASQQWLTELGIWSKLSRACPYRHMAVWDGEGSGAIHFDAADEQHDTLGHIVENRVVVTALWQALEALPQVKVLANCRVESLDLSYSQDLGRVTLSAGDAYLAPLILAADGAGSPLRTMANLPIRQWRYRQNAIVASVRTQLRHDHCAYQRFSQRGPLAFLPLPGDGRDSSIVWSLDEAVAEEMMALDTDAFCQALGQALEWKLGEVTAVEARLSIPLQQCHAVSYYLPGFAVLGDAAHSIHPLAGQGMNLGLADAKVLSGEILRAHQRQLSLTDSSILARYQRQRMGHNLATMTLMEGFKQAFGHPSLALTLVRGWGMKQVDQWPWLKRQFMQLARGA